MWDVLWSDKTFRDWANIIDEGTYMVGELKEGNEVQFLSASGYGVTSHVEKLIPNEHVLLRQVADTKEGGQALRNDEWTGGEESYTLIEKDGVTTLTHESDVPDELVDIFNVSLPQALARIRALAESS